MNVETGKSRKVQINDNVDLLVRKVTITDGDKVIEAVELREYLRNAEVEGHGVFIPIQFASDVGRLVALVGEPA